MNAASDKKRIGLNTFSLWLAKLSQLALGLVLTPLLLIELGIEGYGVCAIAMTIQSLAMVADLRIRVALARELAAALAKQDFDRASRLSSSGMVVYLVIGTTIAAACFCAAPLLASWFRVSPKLFDETVALIRWYGAASILLSFIQPVYSSALAAKNRFDLVNYSELVTNLVRGLTMIAVLLVSTRDLLAWGIVMVVFQVASLAIQRQLALRAVPQIERRWSLVDLRLFGSVLSLGGSLFLLRLAQLLSETLDPIILTTFLGPAAVALYRPSQSLVKMAGPFVTAIREQLHPLTTGAHIEGEQQRLQRLLVVGTRYTVLLGIPVYTVLFVFAQPIVHFWLGASLGPNVAITARLLQGLAVIHFAVCLGGCQWPVLLGTNSVGFVVKIQLPLSLLNLLVSAYLVGFTSLGVLGVVVATIAFSLLQRPILTVYTARITGLRLGEYFRQAYARPLLVLLVVAASALGLQAAIGTETLPRLLMATAGTSGCWLVAAWSVGLEATDRTTFRQLASGSRRRSRNTTQTSTTSETPVSSTQG